MTFKPMLAGKFVASEQRFPCIASPKVDGLRCTVLGGKPYARSMKLIPNLHVQRLVEQHASALEGLDGELVIGDPNDPKVFENTSGPIRRTEGQPDFTFWAFDHVPHDDHRDVNYGMRLLVVESLVNLAPEWAKAVPTRRLTNMQELKAYELEQLELGYEGIMLRDPHGHYKQGRSTTKEGGLLKVKRITDDEAIIVGFEEEMKNLNEATTNELGRTKRSSHQENKVGKGTLGAFVARGLTGKFKGATFHCGTGMTAAQRADFWARRGELLGTAFTYRHFEVGAKDAPRHPVFVRFRDAFDMGEVA